jgi:TolB protein
MRTKLMAFVLLILTFTIVFTVESAESSLKFTQLTNSSYYKSSPCISADGKNLAYSVYKDGKEKIWIRSLMEKSKEYEVPVDVEGTHPSFSPDGDKLVFGSLVNGESNLYIVGIDGNDLKKLKQKGYNAYWSPKGDLIAFVNQHNIGIMNTDGKDVKFLTIERYNDEPCFSPDGKRLVFYSEGKIQTVNIETKEIETIVKDDWNGFPVFSPDGKKLALISTRKGNYDLWVLNLETKDWVQLTNDEAREYSPCWMPDSDAIVFVKRQLGIFDIWEAEGIKTD